MRAVVFALLALSGLWLVFELWTESRTETREEIAGTDVNSANGKTLGQPTAVHPARPAPVAPRHPPPTRGTIFITADEHEVEARDPVWAPAMEAALRETITANLVGLEGARIVELSCRTASCRLVLAMTPELKAQLRSKEEKSVGHLTSELLRRGGLATAVWPLWANGPTGQWWATAYDLVHRDGVPRAFRRLHPWHGMLREESILAFEAWNQTPAAYRAAAATFAHRRAHPGAR